MVYPRPETEQEGAIFLGDGLIRNDENYNNNEGITSVTTQTVIPLVDLIDEPDAGIPNENLRSAQLNRGTPGTIPLLYSHYKRVVISLCHVMLYMCKTSTS